MSDNGQYRILCRRGLLFGLLYKPRYGNDWVTDDDKEAYKFDTFDEANAKLEEVKNKAKEGIECFGGTPLELTIVKIEKVCKAT